MTPVEISADDVVSSWAEAEENAREPLLVLEPLLEFLDSSEIGSGPIEILPLGEGHSNVTFEARRGDLRFVLRRPPRGPLPPSAHDVLREARVLRAIADHARVPRVLAACEDSAVIGAPFYVMEMVDGEILIERLPEGFDSPEGRRRVCEELIDTLIEIHSIDWSACGLESFGKPAGYLERQVRRFTQIWEFNRTREIPQIERVGEWLTKHMPEQGSATIVHGDFRLGNVMYARDLPPRLNAVFDWEMATIGDPLADLGYLSMMWNGPYDPPVLLATSGLDTTTSGFLNRSELFSLYEERSGRKVENGRWYQVLALWKMAVFMEGNYKRSLAGTTDDPFLRMFESGVVQLAVGAEELAFQKGE